MVVVNTYVSESILAKMQGIAKQYTDYLQMKALENPIKAGAYLFVAVVTVLLLFSATWFGFYVARRHHGADPKIGRRDRSRRPRRIST